MNDNIRPSDLKTKVDELNKEIPNLVMPTMGIIEDENKIDINNQEFIRSKETKEDKDVK